MKLESSANLTKATSIISSPSLKSAEIARPEAMREQRSFLQVATGLASMIATAITSYVRPKEKITDADLVNPNQINRPAESYYKATDAILSTDGNLPIKGSLTNREEANRIAAMTLRKHPELIQSLNNSEVVHGSNSSLLAGMISRKEAAILSSFRSKSEKIVNFAGTGDTVYQDTVSTFWLSQVGDAYHYANPAGWSPAAALVTLRENADRLKEAAVGSIVHAQSSHKIELTKERLAAWKSLSRQERNLIKESYPVVVGIAPENGARYGHVFYSGDVAGEVRVNDQVKPEEIKAMFVPRDKVLEVREILSSLGAEHIWVDDIAKIPGFKK